jgi:regulator of protease activity HflC (stomatin/prohibitin superfamily)
MDVAGIVILGAIGFLVLIYFLSGLRIIPQAHAMVIERLGKYSRTLYSGIQFHLPFIEYPRSLHVRFKKIDPEGREITIDKTTKLIDLREKVLDYPKQTVITKDNVVMEIDAVLFYKIVEPAKAIYQIDDLPYAIQQLTLTTLRNVVGEMDLDQTLSSRENINLRLKASLGEVARQWGCEITRVEIQNIEPPSHVKQAMEKQMMAEREKRATILTAEGEKQRQILIADGERDAALRRAEGEKLAQIMKAEGEAEAKLRVADAEAQAITKIREAFGDKGNPANYLIALKYLDSLEKISDGKATKIFLPVESTGILGSLAGIREMLSETKTQT